MHRELIDGFILVFSSVRRTGAAFLMAVFFYAVTVIIQNFSFLREIINLPGVGINEKIISFAAIFTSIGTNFTPLSFVLTVVAAVLFGMDMVFAYHYFRMRGEVLKVSGLYRGATGFFLGIFGAGCAACGSVVLSAAGAFLGGVSFISFLPFGGLEFSLLSVAILFVSVIITARNVGRPLIC